MRAGDEAGRFGDSGVAVAVAPLPRYLVRPGASMDGNLQINRHTRPRSLEKVRRAFEVEGWHGCRSDFRRGFGLFGWGWFRRATRTRRYGAGRRWGDRGGGCRRGS